MIALEKARQQLTDLGLSQAAGILDSRLDTATKKDLTYADFLVDLLDAELAARRDRYLRQTRLAPPTLRRLWTSSTSRSSPPSTSARSGNWPLCRSSRRQPM